MYGSCWLGDVDGEVVAWLDNEVGEIVLFGLWLDINVSGDIVLFGLWLDNVLDGAVVLSRVCMFSGELLLLS